MPGAVGGTGAGCAVVAGGIVTGAAEAAGAKPGVCPIWTGNGIWAGPRLARLAGIPNWFSSGR